MNPVETLSEEERHRRHVQACYNWRRNHPEQAREIARRYYTKLRNEQPDRVRETNQRWRDNNRERYLEQQRNAAKRRYYRQKEANSEFIRLASINC